MLKNKLGTFALLHKLYKQEKLFRKELAKTFLDYLETLPINKRIDQIESLLHETKINSIVTHDSRLTSQEKKCLFSANKGKEVKEMASILGLSPRTIKYHRANIVKKLEVSNLTAAVASR
ncbi:helix-turn-helix transcriptional regulator [Rickettsiella endosymbiont of Aleochara curtula]|uniref:helix-turn-helix domain-containing protein n=1 Tax=Rickettsiella endosymbiont of Aleochara curtula TaxID=3077936 RepID=UPI00313DBFE8